MGKEQKIEKGEIRIGKDREIERNFDRMEGYRDIQ